VLEAADESMHYPFPINAQEVVAFDPKIGYLLIQNPTLLLPVFEEAVLRLQIKLSTSQNPNEEQVRGGLDALRFLNSLMTIIPDEKKIEPPPCFPPQVPLTVKGRVHIRLSHLPPVHELYKPNISSIRASDIGRLIQVSGTGEKAV